jgi:hypothetical protein
VLLGVGHETNVYRSGRHKTITLRTRIRSVAIEVRYWIFSD